jgi:hypothetical protein
VYAAAEARVIYAGDSRNMGWPNLLYLNIDFDRTDNVDNSAGNYIILAHYDAFGNLLAYTGYGHLEEIYVKAGDWVRGRQHIGKIGQTGFSFGKHLHFDFVPNPYNVSFAPFYGRVDPTPYFIDYVEGEEDDMYTDEDRARDVQAAKDAKAAKEALIIGGSSMLYTASIQKLVDDVPRRVAEYPVHRDGKDIFWIQESADAKSLLIAQSKAITGLSAALQVASAGQITIEKIEEIINTAFAESVGDLAATVTIGVPSKTEADDEQPQT